MEEVLGYMLLTFENHNFKKSKRLNLYLKQEKDWGVTKISYYKILKKK